jgi:hypothetical protein
MCIDDTGSIFGSELSDTWTLSGSCSGGSGDCAWHDQLMSWAHAVSSIILAGSLRERFGVPDVPLKLTTASIGADEPLKVRPANMLTATEDGTGHDCPLGLDMKVREQFNTLQPCKLVWIHRNCHSAAFAAVNNCPAQVCATQHVIIAPHDCHTTWQCTK